VVRGFGLKKHREEVKKADPVAMATELRDLLPNAWMEWGHLPPPNPQTITPVGPEQAFVLFMARYEEIKHLARPETSATPASRRRSR